MNLLVLCTGNSCRSQMAEAFLQKELGPSSKVVSAGVEVHGLNPRAVKVMSEKGIDISTKSSNHVDEYLDKPIDVVITVCDHAAEVCPVFPSRTRTIHHSFTDPAKATGTEEEILSEFRRVRDEIEAWSKEFVSGWK